MVNDTLEERGSRYGNYLQQTQISNDLRTVMVNTKGWENLEVDQEDALTMIAVKLSRILNGTPDYSDNMIGYCVETPRRLWATNKVFNMRFIFSSHSTSFRQWLKQKVIIIAGKH